jgi:glycine reductase
MKKLKAVYYLNQFYAGLGGEEKADMGVTVFDEKKGPALGIEPFWQDQMTVEKVIACGDNYMNNEDHFPIAAAAIKKVIQEVQPDVVVAGPAFNAGRYGVACAKVCDFIQKEFNIPAVTAMYYENPAVPMYVREVYIVETPETAVGMRKVLPTLGKLALKLASKEPVGPARVEGYLPRGYRYNEYHERTGAQRAVDMLIKKLNGEPYVTEVPLRALEKVTPAAPLSNMETATVAMITTGGLVPKGNPDKLKQAFSVTFGAYDIQDLASVSSDDYESIHGGYDTTIVDKDPNRLIPLDELRVLEKEGRIKSIYPKFLTTCGIGTNVENGKNIGRGMVATLMEGQVDAAILTST